MNFSIAFIRLKEDGADDRRDILTVTKGQLVMETLGLTVAKGKALLPVSRRCGGRTSSDLLEATPRL